MSLPIPTYNVPTIAANTNMMINAEPSFFLIFNLFSSHFAIGDPITDITHPITNGIKYNASFQPTYTKRIVAVRLNNRLTAIFQYGRVSCILFHL